MLNIVADPKLYFHASQDAVSFIMATFPIVKRKEEEKWCDYRARLVADVVTGKLDVREAAAKLPEQTASLLVDDPSSLLTDDGPDNLDESESGPAEAKA